MADANIYKKLQAVQAQLKVGKNQRNDFGGYNYRSCEDILEAAKPILSEQNSMLIVGDELVLIGDRYYIKATAKFIDCESGQELSNTAYAREPTSKPKMDESQVTGSTSSYARKYALNGLLCLDDVKDADALNNQGTSAKRTSTSAQKKKPPAKDSGGEKVTDAMVKSMQSLIDKYAVRKGLRLDSILYTYNVKSIDQMTVEQYKDCMDRLKMYEG